MCNNGARDAAAIKATLDRGMKELDRRHRRGGRLEALLRAGRRGRASRSFPTASRKRTSSFEIVLEVIEKLKAAGVKTGDMFVYDRYRGELMEAGYHKILPDGIRWGGLDPMSQPVHRSTFPTFANDPIAGFDRDTFVWMDLVRLRRRPQGRPQCTARISASW